MSDVIGHSKVVHPIEIFDSPSADAFGRLRVSEPVTLFDSKLLCEDKAPLFWDEEAESGSGITTSTPDIEKPYIDFTSTLNTACVYTRQTFQRFIYQPGKSHLVLMTGVLDLSGGGTGVSRRIGYFDDNNGVFFSFDDGVASVNIRTSDSGTPVDVTINQNDWNLDRLNGCDDSEVVADWTAAQIFVVDFQWLSVGRVRIGIEIGSTITYVHEVCPANVSNTPWTSSPNLPIRYQMVTTSSSPVSTMRCICSAVISEGGKDPAGILRYKSTEGTHLDADVENTVYALIGVRQKAALINSSVEFTNVGIQVQTGSDTLEWMLILNPTVADTFTYSDTTNSVTQTAVGVTANTVTGGTIIAGGFANASGGGNSSGSDARALESELSLGRAIDGTVDEMVLCVRPNGGSINVDVEGEVTWREIL